MLYFSFVGSEDVESYEDVKSYEEFKITNSVAHFQNLKTWQKCSNSLFLQVNSRCKGQCGIMPPLLGAS